MFESVDGLTEEEKQALGDEKKHRFKQPRALYLTIIICSIGAAVQYVYLGLEAANYGMLC